MSKLKEHEALKIENYGLEVKNIQGKIKANSQSHAIHLQKMSIIELKHKLHEYEEKEFPKTLLNLNKDLEILKKESADFVDKIRKKYKIKSTFGFNPDTLEIITD